MPARLIRSLALATICCLPLALPAPVAAQSPSAADAQAPEAAPNAALQYWRAWNARFPAIFDPKYLEEEFRTAGWIPSPQIASVLDSAQGDIQMLMKAARTEHCDWGIPFREEGFETPLPHLAKLRVSARVLLADSRRLAAAGDSVGACERLAAILLMSRHLRNDRNIYCVRVAQSLAVDIAMREIDRVAAASTLDDASRAILLDALGKVAGPDPFAMREAIREEPVVLRSSVRRLCKGPQSGSIFISKFAPRSTAAERAESGVQQLDEAGLYAAADRLAVLAEEVLANWDLPEPIKIMRDIDAQRRAGDFGAVAVLINSDIPQLRRTVILVENKVKETTAIVNGQPPSTPQPAPTPAK